MSERRESVVHLGNSLSGEPWIVLVGDEPVIFVAGMEARARVTASAPGTFRVAQSDGTILADLHWDDRCPRCHGRFRRGHYLQVTGAGVGWECTDPPGPVEQLAVMGEEG